MLTLSYFFYSVHVFCHASTCKTISIPQYIIHAHIIMTVYCLHHALNNRYQTFVQVECVDLCMVQTKFRINVDLYLLTLFMRLFNRSILECVSKHKNISNLPVSVFARTFSYFLFVGIFLLMYCNKIYIVELFLEH